MITKQKANKPSYVTISVTSRHWKVTNRQTNGLPKEVTLHGKAGYFLFFGP